MEKIYSRKRINLPKIYFSKMPNGKKDLKKQKMLEISVILIIAILIMFMIIKGINPVIDRLCVEESRRKATIISNKEATEVMKNFTYEDMVSIYRDNDGNVKMLKSNIIAINAVTSDVAVRIQEGFQKDSEGIINLKFRKLSWK